ncbi:unnamed protein product [Paramecium primaurelia]|uniref:Uncharacterized protein n=1 Tax=Paramecium primaurelia TaxID=5886 RepID=A0A8S1K781_PARPR|nr:unnamed protein product [Paramecium primaurelia]
MILLYHNNQIVNKQHFQREISLKVIIKLNSKLITLQQQYLHNDNLLQTELIYKSYLLQQNYGDNCDPYGQRISLGYYYKNYDKLDNIIDITYNTQSYCPQGFLHIFDQNGIDQWIKIKEIRILNMSKVYENSNSAFTYVKYINIVSLNSYVIQRLGQIYYYEIYEAIDIKSKQYQFKVPLKQYDNKEHKIIFFGDMDSNWTGNKSKQTFDWFQSIQYNQRKYGGIGIFYFIRRQKIKEQLLP